MITDLREASLVFIQLNLSGTYGAHLRDDESRDEQRDSPSNATMFAIKK
jgi:hypothetical protein